MPSGVRGTREGGPDVYKSGSLKRRLPIVTVCELSPTDETGVVTAFTTRLLLKNLNADLKVHIMAAVASNVGIDPIEAGDVPAGAATMQLVPKALPPDSPPLFLRPVFQNPALAQNENHPLPQDIPFGWEFSTNTDEVAIDIVITPLLWDSTELRGKILVMVDIQYDGAWWDTKAVAFAIGQVQLVGGNVVTVFTG